MLTVTDLFCGAGGSSQGAEVVPGIQVVMAANHWDLAIKTHQTNYPSVDHDCADISQVDPRRYPRTDILWASPECTNHSGAKGRKRSAQPSLFDRPDPAAERSRATMWDVPRFAEHHRYEAIIVENVVEAARWEMWPAWLHAMQCLGYEYRTVWLNSMHAPAQGGPRAPQSRDRLYVVFWRKGNRAPDVDPRPVAPCQECGHDVVATQVFKKRERWGRYRAQYQYVCPTPRCHQVVEPYVSPAASAIDWALPGERIGDRSSPLKEATLRRIRAGLERFAAAPQLIPAGGTWNDGAMPVDVPMRARTTRETEGLLVPVEARDGKEARPAEEPLRTQTTRAETALVVPYYRTGTAHGADEPMPTLTTRDRVGVAFVAELRGGGSDARNVTEPLSTVTASGNHHMLVRNNGSRGEGAEMCTPVSEPARTLTTAGHQSLVGWPADQQPPQVDDCTFRMLAPHEVSAAMGFRADYEVHGTKRQQVKQYGNAVTPPAATHLLSAIGQSLAT